MLGLAVLSVCIAAWSNAAGWGRARGDPRPDELAAECSGVPTLKLKLVSTTA